MRAHGRTKSIVLGSLLCLASIGGAQAAGPAAFFLLTPQEAERLALPANRWRPAPRMRGIPRGPRVVVRQPHVIAANDGPIIETNSPTAFIVSFEDNGAPVDMDSLEIRAKKGIFSKSLTDRLKPYLQGTVLDAEAVNVPEGRFLIQIEIADKAGERTVETYRLEVKAQ